MFKLLESVLNLVVGVISISVGCVTFIVLMGMVLLPILIILALL